MTISIQSGPSWVSLASDGRLIGTPTAIGSYPVVLASAVGVYSATTTVTIIVSQLAPVYFDVVSQLLAIGTVALSFQAYIGPQEPTMFPMFLSFGAVSVSVAYIGKVLLSFDIKSASILVTQLGPLAMSFSIDSAIVTQGQSVFTLTANVSQSLLANNVSPKTFSIFKPNGTGGIVVNFTNIQPAAGATDIQVSIIGPSPSTTVVQSLSITSTANVTLTTATLAAGTYTMSMTWVSTPSNALTVTGTWDVPLANDNFADATTINATCSPMSQSIVLTGSNVGATKETNELPTDNRYQKTLWFKFTAPSTVSYQFNTVGSAFDTLLTVFSGTSFTNLVQLSTDDDSGGSGTSSLSIGLTSGQQYYIQVAGYNGAQGNYALRVNYTCV